MLRALGADHVIDYQTEDFTKSRRRYDLILDTKTTRSRWAYARAQFGRSLCHRCRLDAGALEALLLAPLIARLSRKHVRMVVLKPNKDLRFMSELFQSGRLRPVIDGPYKLADIADTFRHFGAANHKGKIVVTMGWQR